MPLPDPIPKSNRLGIEFLDTELKLAHTFMDSAAVSQYAERIKQGHKDAQTAYRSVLHFLPRLKLSPEEKISFDEQIKVLRERLLHAGIEL